MTGISFALWAVGILLFLIQLVAAYVVLMSELSARIRRQFPEAWRELGSPSDAMAAMHRGSAALAFYVLAGTFRTLDSGDIRRLGSICRALLASSFACLAMLVLLLICAWPAVGTF